MIGQNLKNRPLTPNDIGCFSFEKQHPSTDFLAIFNEKAGCGAGFGRV
jgi:hypothetical protein